MSQKVIASGWIKVWYGNTELPGNEKNRDLVCVIHTYLFWFPVYLQYIHHATLELWWTHNRFILCNKRKSSLNDRLISGQLAFHQFFFKPANKSSRLNPNTRLNFYHLSPLNGVYQDLRDVRSVQSHMVFHKNTPVKGWLFGVWNLTSLHISLLLAQSVSQSDAIKLRVKWKVKWMSPCLVPWLVICRPMWSTWQRSLMDDVATAVISQAKWAHVGHAGPYWTALDQKDSFQQTALHGS